MSRIGKNPIPIPAGVTVAVPSLPTTTPAARFDKAIAEGKVIMRTETLDLVAEGNALTGDVLGAARLAGRSAGCGGCPRSRS